MIMRFVGIIVLAISITAALTGCGTSADAGDSVAGTTRPTSVTAIAASLVQAKDDAQLVQWSDLVIYGVPIGEIEVRPPKIQYSYSKYFQDVRILDVLKGEWSGDTLQVVQFGYDQSERQRLKDEEDRVIIVSNEEDFPGPLARGPQILFLRGPKTGVPETGLFSVVGFRQGAFLIDPDERVASAQEFKSFEGLDVDQVKQRIEALSQP